MFWHVSCVSTGGKEKQEMPDSIGAIASTGTQDVVPRQNFARSAEALAAAGVAGFDDYVASFQEKNAPLGAQTPSQEVQPCSFRGVPAGPQMSYQDDNFSFSDVVDILNPLQHIPVVGTIYRMTTGDSEVKPYAQLVGDLLYGGIIGEPVLAVAASLSSAVIEESTGLPPDHQIAMAVFGPGDEAAANQNSATAQAHMASPALVMAQASVSQNQEVNLATKKSSQKSEQGNVIDSSGVKKPNVMQTAHATLLRPDNQNSQEKPTAAPIEKQPFGGVLDVDQVRRAQARTTATQVGDKIYPHLSADRGAAEARARLAAPLAEAPKVKVSENGKVVSANDLLVQTAATSQPAVQSAQTMQLGALMHDSAQHVMTTAQAQGKNDHALPPELVQDMMLMALDKYKTGGSVSSGGVTIE